MKKTTIFVSLLCLCVINLHAQIKPDPESDAQATVMNINTVTMWVYSDGRIGADPHDQSAGVRFPGRQSGIIYQAGLLWAGKVKNGAEPALRAGGSNYRTGLRPVQFPIFNSSQPVSIWRVRRDFATADLRDDAAALYGVAPGQVTEQQVQKVYEDYKRDWQHWPWQAGAPFYDADGDGRYTPEFDNQGNPVLYPHADEPGIANADQVIWFTANDYDPEQTEWLYGSPPMGLSVQVTLWAYKGREYAQNKILENTVYVRHRLINTGWQQEPESAGIEDLHVSFWIDTDIGYYADDFSGTNPELAMAYGYNSTMLDTAWTRLNLAPPAAGVALVQGPVVPAPVGEQARFDLSTRAGYANISPTSAWLHGSGSSVPPPPMGIYNGTLGLWNIVRGYYTYPLNNPQPFVDVDGRITPFPKSGDPVKGTGTLDRNPGNRSIYLNTGKFSLAKGDSNEVIHALVAGMGSSNLSSVGAMRLEAKWAHFIAKYNFDVGFDPVITGVDEPATQPLDFQLFANYPNPFNPGTTIRYSIPRDTHVRLTVHNILGQPIATLLDETRAAGTHNVIWNGKTDSGADAAAGVYFYRLEAGSMSALRKMVLVR